MQTIANTNLPEFFLVGRDNVIRGPFRHTDRDVRDSGNCVILNALDAKRYYPATSLVYETVDGAREALADIFDAKAERLADKAAHLRAVASEGKAAAERQAWAKRNPGAN
jgi:hypothetical protein